MDYITFKELPLSIQQNQLLNSIHSHRGKLKIRLFNTNEDYASIPSYYNNHEQSVQLQKQLVNYQNITSSQVDYIDGQYSGNRKIDLIISPRVETRENLLLLLDSLRLVDNIDSKVITRFERFL